MTTHSPSFRVRTARILGVLLASGVAVTLASCSDERQRRYDDYGGYADSCATYDSCGTCTPVVGCGWCYNGDGTGTCTNGPDQCPALEFSWTWEPSGCRSPADAGVSTKDAAGDQDTGPSPDAQTADDANGSIDTGLPADAGTALDASGTTDASTMDDASSDATSE
jgi:hypothetical protein